VNKIFCVKISGRIKKLLIFMFLAAPVLIFIMASSNKTEASLLRGSDFTLVIDPGHGGIDSGATAADGSKESDINLAIALKIRAIAEFCGQDNVLIRQDDRTMSDTPDYSEHRDLERRAEITSKAENPVYISIHQNCFPTGQPNGPLVIYSSFAESEKLGKMLHQNLLACLYPENRRMAEPALDKYYVLSTLECPAVLVECGFMSNFSDIEKLKNEQYQTALATVIMASYTQFSQEARYI